MRPKVILGAVGVLLLGVTIQLIVIARDKPTNTASHRITDPPDTVVDRYLRDRLVDRDDAVAKTLQCRSPSLAPMDRFVADLKDREGRFNVEITSSWADLQSSTTPAGQATVQLNLIRTVLPNRERTSDTWMFTLTGEGGWKVCDAQPIAQQP
jgi:hypothetical protein